MVTTEIVPQKLNTSLECAKPAGQVTKRWQTHRDDGRPVSFITESEVNHLCDICRQDKLHGARNELLLLLLFQGCLRVSEALDIRLRDVEKKDGMFLLLVEHGKGPRVSGGKARLIAIPELLYMRIRTYCSETGISDRDELIFKITRFRAWQIARETADKAGINKRIYCHLFRHGGSVARLIKTGNLKSLQLYLGHTDSKMTMRYQNTMQIIQALEVESKVEFSR